MMGVYANYVLSGVTIFTTIFLLVLARINHSCGSGRYRIMKAGLWLLLVCQLFGLLRIGIRSGGCVLPLPIVYLVMVGYHLCAVTVMILIVLYMLLQFPKIRDNAQLAGTIFFVCEFVAAALILTTLQTGFIYRVESGNIVEGIADTLFFWLQIGVLAGFLVTVPLFRSQLAPKLFQNWIATLISMIVVHLLTLVVPQVELFAVTSNLFFAAAFCLFYSGSYEEGTARMRMDMYRSELEYLRNRNISHIVMELKILNYDRLIELERRGHSEEELDGIYSALAARLRGERKVILFQKSPASIGIVMPAARTDQAAEVAQRLCGWMQELLNGDLQFRLSALEAPRYAADDSERERLLRFLRRQCPDNGWYFCSDADYEAFCERNHILSLLDHMRLEKQDVVLFVRPVIACAGERLSCFEILCRLQLPGSGIVQSEQIIRLAEQYGYIHDVNMVVLENICDFLETEAAVREKIQVTLHISGDELTNPGFAQDVMRVLQSHSFAPEVLGFEVTMASEPNDIACMREVMRQLRDHQIRFVLSDVEPAVVNFEGIAGLPFDSVKFAGSCVRRACADSEFFEVIGMLVDLLKDHGYSIIFKGVDNEELSDIAMSLGADYLQGKKFAKPMPIEHLEEHLDLQMMF